MADVAAQLTVPSAMRIESVIQPELPSVLLERISRTMPLLAVGQTTSPGASGCCSARSPLRRRARRLAR